MIVARGAGLVEAEVDGEMVGLHIENGICYGFNTTATRLWQLIEQPQSLSAICDALVDEFDVEPDQCEADVRALIADLQNDGILVISESGTA